MSRWMEQLSTWQFALFWGVATLVAAFLGGALIQWLLKGHLDLSFLIPYDLLFAAGTTIAPTIRHRSRRRKHETQ